MAASTDTGLLAVLILYIRSQDELYINNHEGFTYLAEWLAEAKDDDTILYNAHYTYYPASEAPDICRKCLGEFAATVGGRVRYGCSLCNGAIDYSNEVLHTIWPYKFAQILKVTEACFDFHLSQALWYIKQARQGVTS